MCHYQERLVELEENQLRAAPSSSQAGPPALPGLPAWRIICACKDSAPCVRESELWIPPTRHCLLEIPCTVTYALTVCAACAALSLAGRRCGEVTRPYRLPSKHRRPSEKDETMCGSSFLVFKGVVPGGQQCIRLCCP